LVLKRHLLLVLVPKVDFLKLELFKFSKVQLLFLWDYFHFLIVEELSYKEENFKPDSNILFVHQLC
jgi:hypothetical protein